MSMREVLAEAGIHVYGLGAMALGAIGLIWGDFATIWQPVQALPFILPQRQAFAYIVATILLVAGAAMQWRGAARVGALTVAVVNFLFAVCWLPRVVGFPQVFGTWGGFFEALCPVTAGAILYVTSSPRTAQAAHYLFAICVISFGIAHFAALPQTAGMVPKWVPPGQTFWAAATGVFHLLAGIAILSGVLDLLASRLLTLMLIVFGALVWMPQLFSSPHDHIAWAGNAVNLVLTGTAWVNADWLARHKAHR